MNKREFLKAGSLGVAAAAFASPARSALPARRIAIVQPTLPGADAFSVAERAAGSQLLTPQGDPVRWFRETLRPVLNGADVAAFTDPAHTLVLEGSLREAGYARVGGHHRQHGRAIAWAAARRKA